MALDPQHKKSTLKYVYMGQAYLHDFVLQDSQDYIVRLLS